MDDTFVGIFVTGGIGPMFWVGTNTDPPQIVRNNYNGPAMDDFTGIDATAGEGPTYWRGEITRHVLPDRFHVTITHSNTDFVIGETYLILQSQVENYILKN